MHRLADDVLAKHGADGGQPVTAAGERRAAGTLEMEVAQLSLGVDEFTEQQRPAVAETRHPAAELMSRIALRNRIGARGHHGSGEQPKTVGAA